MKVLAIILFTCLFSSLASPKIYTIQFGGKLDSSYVPNVLNVNVGDSIKWLGDFTTYSLESTLVPSGALPFGPVNTGDTFLYVIKTQGEYDYQNNKYAANGMKGTITATKLLYGLTNEGREFYLGMLYPSYNNVEVIYEAKDFEVFALIQSYYDNEVTVTYLDASGNDIQPSNYTLNAGNGKAFKLPLNANIMQMDTASDIPVYKSCHIRSKNSITVSYISLGACASGSYLALPVLGLGKNYVAACYNDNPGGGALLGNTTNAPYLPSSFDYAGGEFLVIGTENSTNVKITPATTTGTGHLGANTGIPYPYTISLNRGQCYLVRSDGLNEDHDMSGSLIEASKPVAVLSGHENAMLGGVDTFSMEARDFMIEQMIPVEYWDSAGYIGMPFYEGNPPSSDGNGDSYRIYAFDTIAAKVHLDIQGISGGYDISTRRLLSPSQKNDVTTPAEAYSTNGKKFALMQYDQRSQPLTAPYPAPSMMTIIPKSRWKKSYFICASANLLSASQVIFNGYINVISSNLANISVSIDGRNSTSLSSLTRIGGFTNVSSTFPELRSGQYKSTVFAPVTYYYLSSSTPFAVYYYGMQEFSTVPGQLGMHYGPNMISEYAAPGGTQLNSGVTPSFIVDTQITCSGWHVCIRDTGNTDPGLKAAILIDDTDGIYWQNPAKYSNVSFDETSIDYADGELHPHWHSNSAYCFDVNFASPLAAVAAPLAIVDNLGNAIILRLDRTAPTVKLTTNPATSTRADSIVFPVKQIGTQICTTFVLKNTALKNGTAINLNSVQLSKTDTSFKANTSNINFPHSIAAGDSVSFQVCYTPIDSFRHQGTLILKSDCFSIPISLDAHGSTGLISAGDLDFKTVYVGDTSCKAIQIKNVGSAPFTLTSSYLNSDTLNFTVDALKLPATINPGSYTIINVCFHPQAVQTYSDSIMWSTDLEATFKHSLKDHSILSGEGIQKAGVKSVAEENSFTIRPNPANGNYVIITCQGWTEVHSTMVVFDVLGREVYKREISSGTSQVQIPIQNLPEGTYYVRLISGSGSVTQRFTKVKR